MTQTEHWTLRIPSEKAKQLEALQKQLGFETRNELLLKILDIPNLETIFQDLKKRGLGEPLGIEELPSEDMKEEKSCFAKPIPSENPIYQDYLRKKRSVELAYEKQKAREKAHSEGIAERLKIQREERQKRLADQSEIEYEQWKRKEDDLARQGKRTGSKIDNYPYGIPDEAFYS